MSTCCECGKHTEGKKDIPFTARLSKEENKKLNLVLGKLFTSKTGFLRDCIEEKYQELTEE